MTVYNRSVSVVVPVYNSAALLEQLVARVDTALASEDFEIVFVNDGSGDDSWAQIEELARTHERVRGVDLMRNYGQHNALLAGIRAAEGAAIVTIDDDLQNPPEEIPRLLAELAGGADVVYGTTTGEQYGFWRGFGTRLTKLALRGAVGNEIAGKVGAFRAFRTELRGPFDQYSGPQVNIDVLLHWGTRRYGWAQVAHHPRADGSSSYTFTRLATHALNVLTGFSTRPLRLASLVGLAFTLFGFVVLAVVIGSYAIRGGWCRGSRFSHR